MKIHFITYGNKVFKEAVKRICKEAENSEWFDTITPYGPDDLEDDFKEEFKDVLSKPCGGGYWIWKNNIIQQSLNKINYGDILVYLDSGCTINKKANERFYEYIELLKNSNFGIISMQMKHREKIWTTKEIFNYFNIDPNSDIGNSGQFLGGIRIMKKNEHLINLIKLEKKVYSDNYLLVTDHYNKNQSKYFKDNRHEQSVFSVLRKIHGSIAIPDETYFKPNYGKGESLKYPIWATRMKN
jgi:hypothetical protein